MRLARIALCFVPGLMPGSAAAQYTEASILTGVDSVDARVSLTWDTRITQPPEATMSSRLQTVFELELRKLGIVVSTGASNYLDLAFTTLDNETGTVSFAHGLELRETGLPNRVLVGLMLSGFSADTALARRLRSADSVRADRELSARMWEAFTAAYWAHKTPWIVTWEGPRGIVTVGKARLQESLERKAVEAAQAFANAWLANRRK